MDCTPRTRTSSCFDADTLWIPAAPSPFRAMPASEVMAAERWSLGLDVSYLSRPVTLTAHSPDPSGRTVRVVNDVVDAALSAAYVPAPHWELTAVVPVDLYRTGTGLSGVTSQSGPSLTSTALRDVRIGAARALLPHSAAGSAVRFSATSHLDLALPTGDGGSFAGEGGPVLAPAIAVGLETRGVLVEAEEVARIESARDFGGARVGSRFVSNLGVSAEVLPRGALGASIEGWVAPNFLSTGRTLPDGTVVTSGALVPAEWMASLWTRLTSVVLALGGGTAIPLSSETRRAPDGTESSDQFAGITTPRFRFVFSARYAPEAP